MDVLAVDGPIVPSDIPQLCERARIFVESCSDDVVVCDVQRLADPDIAAVDALARIQLLARQSGSRIVLAHASERLVDLLELAGLREAIPLWDDLRIQMRGQAE